MRRRRLRSCRANGRIERGRRGDKERGRRTANNGQESVVLARTRIANNNRDNGRTVNNPMVNNPASDNLENDRPANNQTVSSRDSLKAISLSVGSSRDSNQVNDCRGKLKKDNLNPASNRISQDRPVSNLKKVSGSRDNHSRANGGSEVLRDWLTTINREDRSNQQVARIASSRRSAAKIFSTGLIACAMSRKWWTIPNSEPKPLASAIKPARSARS